METPAPDPNKLLQSWMEWERGEVTPGRVMANLKTGGLRELLEGIVAGGGAGPARPAAQGDPGTVRAGEDRTTVATGGAEGEAAASSAPPHETPGGQPATWAPVV
ncbi:MAG TPA: hypothetical protein VEJ84_02815 [Acidimicrobiales bacterium]|nr:hypothetical protein [Acidimicrobiales bacterium]